MRVFGIRFIGVQNFNQVLGDEDWVHQRQRSISSPGNGIWFAPNINTRGRILPKDYDISLFLMPIKHVNLVCI